MKRWMAVALLAAATLAHAQSSPAKKEMVAKLLQLQQPDIEQLARQLTEQPAAQLLQQAGPALQSRVAPDKREAVAKDIQADAKKYVEETVPLVRDRAIKLAPSTVGVMLEEKFSEDELRQLLAWFESPVKRKFMQMGGDLQKTLAEKLVADVRPQVEPKVRALEQSVGKRLGIEPTATAPAPSPAPAAVPAPAAKPAPK